MQFGRWSVRCFIGLLLIPFETFALTVKIKDRATIPCLRNCSTITWESKGINIVHFDGGNVTVAPEYKDRIEFSIEKLRAGDASLTITSVVFNDQEWYVCSCDGKKLCDRKIEVIVPTQLNRSVGEKAVVECYAKTDKRTDDSTAYVLWTKDGGPAVKLENGEMEYGPGFEGRASVSLKAFREGDLSLTIDDVRLSDSGLYRCSLKDDEHGYPTAVTLSVQAHQHKYEKMEGDSVLLDVAMLHSQSVSITKIGDNTIADSQLCSGPQGFMKCSSAYTPRISQVENGIILSKLSVTDSGTYTVTDLRSDEITAVHKISVRALPSTKLPGVGVSVAFALLLLLPVAFFIWREWSSRRKQQKVKKGTEESATSDENVQLSVAQYESSSRSPQPWNDKGQLNDRSSVSQPETQELSQ